MRNELKVGIFVFAALGLLLFVLDFVGDIPFLKNEHRMTAYFDSVAELREGNPVKMEGVPVGKIDSIVIDNGRIAVIMSVRKDAPVRKDSKASIRLTSLLGTSYVNISFGSQAAPLATPPFVLETEPSADLNEILVKLQSAADSMDSALGAFAALGDHQEEIGQIFTNLNTVLADMSEGKGTIGRLIKDDTLYNEISGTFANINEISGSIRDGKGTLGKLLHDDSLYYETRTAMENLGSVSAKLADAEGTIGKLLNDDKLYDEATEAAASLNSILKKIDSGQGTIGKLVNEDEIYYDARNTLLKVDRTVDTVEDLAPLGTLGAILGVMTVF